MSNPTPPLSRTSVSATAKLKAVGGSRIDDFNDIAMDQAISSLWLANSNPARREKQRATAITAMIGIKPADEIEGMLAVQMVAAHNATMECYRRAMLDEQTLEGRDNNLKHAGKLSRVYGELLLALDKHRGKGQQRVTVEHVHIHHGGQAIVGTVTQGGGVPSKLEDQPHAPGLTYQPGQILPGEIETLRETVQGARG
jgi:hypothetical protein